MSNEFKPKYEIIMGKSIHFQEDGKDIEILIGQKKEELEQLIGKSDRICNMEFLKDTVKNWEEKFGGLETASYISRYELKLCYKYNVLVTISVLAPAKAMLFGKDLANRSKKKIVEHLKQHGHEGSCRSEDFEFPSAGIAFYSPENVPQDITIGLINDPKMFRSIKK
ncbi:hypothetical protein [Fluviispira vulneris]|uniref:hypothetical protein n=1 Tax=Fluviispira vulneris TaxID=2763012 RepID=UPI0016496E7C|nr:hypothetical protein [Fluviispira vulneris]